MATASEQGTLIRTFNTKTGEKINEFRRGTIPCIIHDLAFDQDGGFLTCCSDRPKIHVFKTQVQNTKSYFSILGSFGLPIVNSEWSFA